MGLLNFNFMQTEMIKAKDVLKVIKNFKRIPFYARGPLSLNMNNCGVYMSGICGTPHCHGGWYVHAKHKVFENITKGLGYSQGAKMMAKDLGFESVQELTNWAKANPIIWGNIYGHLMFSTNCAFSSPSKPDGAKSLNDIIKHWKEVYARIVEIEKEKKIGYPDITSELAVLPADEVPDTKIKEMV